MDTLKKTPLHDWHIRNGATMGAFEGWLLPLWYRDDGRKESFAAQNEALIFDNSYLGIISVRGLDAGKFAQNVSVKDIGALNMGDLEQTFLTKKDGRIVDHVTISKSSNTRFFFTVSANMVAKIHAWFLELQRTESFDVNITLPDDYVIFEVHGSFAEDVLHKTDMIHNQILPEKKNSFVVLAPYGHTMVVLRTGKDRFEVIYTKKFAEALWEEFFTSAKNSEISLLPCGVTMREALRLSPFIEKKG